MVPAGTPEAITIIGRVYDGAGNALPDAMIETWQAAPDGRFAHPDDPRGPCQAARGASAASAGARPPRTARTGSSRSSPAPLPTPDGEIEAPHLDVSVFARGLLDRVVTRLYFPDEAAANAADPVLCSVAEARRATLIAVAEPEGQLRFDVWLQGQGETVFFDV